MVSCGYRCVVRGRHRCVVLKGHTRGCGQSWATETGVDNLKACACQRRDGYCILLNSSYLSIYGYPPPRCLLICLCFLQSFACVLCIWRDEKKSAGLLCKASVSLLLMIRQMHFLAAVHCSPFNRGHTSSWRLVNTYTRITCGVAYVCSNTLSLDIPRVSFK
jgi:hypothetical protein